jgi:hypothetical protein
MKEVATKEVVLRQPCLAVDTATLLACIATILELSPRELPTLRADDASAVEWNVSRWLGGRGLGLVRVAEPGSFAWAGPWIARLSADGRRDRRHVVMYGVPSGLVWDPAGAGALGSGTIEAGFVVAATDVALARPPSVAAPTSTGVVDSIWVAGSAGERGRTLASAYAVAGSGLDGDRYAAGAGTFPSGASGSALTLIEAEVCETFEPPLRADEHRRNLVTRGIPLNALVGCEFTIGNVRCRGVRLCEPCRVVDGYAARPLLRALVHRGGLRADVVEGGAIHVGDEVRAATSPRDAN